MSLDALYLIILFLFTTTLTASFGVYFYYQQYSNLRKRYVEVASEYLKIAVEMQTAQIAVVKSLSELESELEKKIKLPPNNLN